MWPHQVSHRIADRAKNIPSNSDQSEHKLQRVTAVYRQADGCQDVSRWGSLSKSLSRSLESSMPILVFLNAFNSRTDEHECRSEDSAHFDFWPHLTTKWCLDMKTTLMRINGRVFLRSPLVVITVARRKALLVRSSASMVVVCCRISWRRALSFIWKNWSLSSSSDKRKVPMDSSNSVHEGWWLVPDQVEGIALIISARRVSVDLFPTT